MRRTALRVATVLLLATAAACVTEEPVPRRVLPGPEAAVPLALETWAKTSLECSAPADPTRADGGVCRRWYRLALPSREELRIDVYAPAGPDVPDFDVRLEDARGDVLWGYGPTGHSPRQVRRVLGAGEYFLLLESIGDVPGKLDVELFAAATAVGSATRVGPRRPATRGPSPAPPAVEGPQVWMGAEILSVEGRGGHPAFVVIDAGARDGLAPGLGGELVEAGVRIGVFVLVEVEPSKSRGRFDAPPIAAITYDTRARIRMPLDGGR